ncbi:hypothetical protein M406DRAFT_45714 [Cryphonectria parasitica EP155]|uniref:Thioesterase family protein n=1 Tax=Cryphonectria parasitica (strain ATCC 38755 / EP155) TaxID=660469 RepID=A0A9P5CLW6_CRYP1|nr:uncharacterized protein M406DRAFT_45714 [Cryphonectria parasitica EP155]KAF3762471.1 hypothetical protein M406DRAFT_45714 [Cryphonectria parasitica EP155]
MASEKARTVVPLSDATKVEKLDSHTYLINLDKTYCIGAVPNGGYTASCILSAARAHLESRDQPDALAAHFEFPRRTTAGPAIITIEEVKLGAQLSTLHLTLWQDGLIQQAPWTTANVSRRCVLAYATQMNQRTYTGMSIPTGYESSPDAALPSPAPDFTSFKTKHGDDGWEEQEMPTSQLLQSLQKWRFYHPRGGRPLTPGVMDLWMCLASGERIMQLALPYVGKCVPDSVVSWRPCQTPEATTKKPEREEKGGRDHPRDGLWFPTVSMNLEVKMALPEDGVEWLNMRVTSKQMKDGRFDLDVLVRDVDGQLVALGHQVALISTMEKNRNKEATSAKASL